MYVEIISNDPVASHLKIRFNHLFGYSTAASTLRYLALFETNKYTETISSERDVSRDPRQKSHESVSMHPDERITSTPGHA